MAKATKINKNKNSTIYLIKLKNMSKQNITKLGIDPPYLGERPETLQKHIIFDKWFCKFLIHFFRGKKIDEIFPCI